MNNIHRHFTNRWLRLLMFVKNDYLTYNKKRGAKLMLVPHSKGLRITQSVETSNAKTPRGNIYNSIMP